MLVEPTAVYCAGAVGEVWAGLAGGGVKPGRAGFAGVGAGSGAVLPAVGLFSFIAVLVGPWPAPNTMAIRTTITTAPASQPQPEPYERPAGSYSPPCHIGSLGFR